MRGKVAQLESVCICEKETCHGRSQQQLEKAQHVCWGKKNAFKCPAGHAEDETFVISTARRAHPPSPYYLETRDGFGFCESGFKSQV